MDINQEQKKRLEQQFAFIREIDKEKFIGRQTYLTDGERKENDAEHAWHMAIMTVLLAEYSNEPIDVLKTVTMLLIHDLVEIDAGDTYAYDEEAKKTQRERELKGAERIFGMLPPDQREKLRALWDEFEAGETPEARFAHTMDNIQPTMLNDASKGKAWETRGVCLSQILGRNKNTAKGSETLWNYSYLSGSYRKRYVSFATSSSYCHQKSERQRRNRRSDFLCFLPVRHLRTGRAVDREHPTNCRSHGSAGSSGRVYTLKLPDETGFQSK